MSSRRRVPASQAAVHLFLIIESTNRKVNLSAGTKINKDSEIVEDEDCAKRGQCSAGQSSGSADRVSTH